MRVNIKKKIFYSIILITISIIIWFLIFADNKNIEKTPNEVITLNFEFTNVFLIPIKNGYALIDNAYEKEYNKFLVYLKKQEISINDIKYILLTHHHDDHVGFLNQITSINPNVSIILHKKTAELLSKGVNNKKNGGGIVNKKIYTLFKIKQKISPDWNLSFSPYRIREKDIIINKDEVDLKKMLEIDIKAIYTPGHSSDSVTYIYKKKYAFCGDLSSNYLNWAGANYLTLFNENITEVYNSWRTLINKNIIIVIPSHGKAFNIKNLKNNIDLKNQENIVKFFE